MDRAFRDGSAIQRDEKEYQRFCRFRGLFLVDGLDSWRSALKARGVPEEEIRAKIEAAADFVKSLGEPSSDFQGA